MSRLVTIALLAAACLILQPRPVHATVHEGDLPPDFQVLLEKVPVVVSKV